MSSSINDLQVAVLVEPAKSATPSLVSEAHKKVRLGGMSPCFTAASVADTGKVRLGGMSPTF